MENNPSETELKLNKMLKKELIDILNTYKIYGFSNHKKDQIIKELLNHNIKI